MIGDLEIAIRRRYYGEIDQRSVKTAYLKDRKFQKVIYKSFFYSINFGKYLNAYVLNERISNFSGFVFQEQVCLLYLPRLTPFSS